MSLICIVRSEALIFILVLMYMHPMSSNGYLLILLTISAERRLTQRRCHHHTAFSVRVSQILTPRASSSNSPALSPLPPTVNDAASLASPGGERRSLFSQCCCGSFSHALLGIGSHRHQLIRGTIAAADLSAAQHVSSVALPPPVLWSGDGRSKHTSSSIGTRLVLWEVALAKGLNEGSNGEKNDARCETGRNRKKEPFLLHTTTIVEKCTLKLVDEYKHMLTQATEPLPTFLAFVIYGHMIDNVVLLVTGTLHERDAIIWECLTALPLLL
ncbi:hypothetical protein AAHA92_29096 [Salvia divinorum]|uniref:Uncharacterized protein n=1 Tax=Salvia divinorum TaxID=28513 RepID=A0ABD1FX92_SALDI